MSARTPDVLAIDPQPGEFLMKKTLIALAAVAASSVALAQNVTISGGMGVAFEKNGSTDGELKNSDGGNGVNFTGTEDLGGGLKATFRFNPRFSSVTGATIGTALAQNASVSLSGGFGTLQFGREGMASASGFDAFAAFGEAGNYGWSGKVGARTDNIMLYVSPTFGGISVRAAMTANNANAGNEFTYFRASYSAGPLALTVAQEKNPSTVAGTKGATDKEFALSYDLGVAKVLAVSGKAGTAASESTIGATVPMGAITLKAAYKNATANVFAIGADYALSKRTRGFADLGKASGSKANYRVGVQHSF